VQTCTSCAAPLLQLVQQSYLAAKLQTQRAWRDHLLSKDRLESYFIRVRLHIEPKPSGLFTDCENREVLHTDSGVKMIDYFMTTSILMVGL
jgi:hypothetical protein